MRLFISFFILSLLLLPACTLLDCENDVVGSYEFVLPITLSPALDTFRVGDTITLSSTFSNEVFERKTGKTFMLDDFQFYPKTWLSKIDTFPQNSSAIMEMFDHVVSKGEDYGFFTFSSGATQLTEEYEYDGENYALEIKFIPKRAGLFMLSQVSSVENLGPDQSFPGKCRNEEVGAVSNLNNQEGDNNRELIYETADPTLITWVENGSGDRYADSGSYCFYVVE